MIEYIFCINTGRSGSEYLAKLLNHCDGIDAYHEHIPIMYGTAMRKFLEGKPDLLKQKMPEKINQINKAHVSDVYVETNHLFIKGFGWLIPEYIDEKKIGVIILKRDPKKIVDSFMRINSTPLNPGRDWQITPLKKNKLIKSSASKTWIYKFYRAFWKLSRKKGFQTFFGSKKMSFVEKYERRLLEWYVEETDAMCQQFMQIFPDITFYEVDIEALNQAATYEEMFSHFGIRFSPNAQFYEDLGQKTNLKR